MRGQFEHACRQLGLEPIFVEIAVADEIGGAIAQVARQRAQALVLRGDSFISDHRVEIAGAAMKHGLPTMTESPDIMRDSGVLASYSLTEVEAERRAASYVDRILRGARPADLPVEQPTKFELVINLRTARALALTIPHSVLLRADAVIQ